MQCSLFSKEWQLSLVRPCVITTHITQVLALQGPRTFTSCFLLLLATIQIVMDILAFYLCPLYCLWVPKGSPVLENSGLKTVPFFFSFMCIWCVHVCVYTLFAWVSMQMHAFCECACGGLRMVSGIIHGCFSSLIIEAVAQSKPKLSHVPMPASQLDMGIPVSAFQGWGYR